MKLVELLTVVLVALLAFVGAKGIDRRAERIVGVYLLHLALLRNHLANVAQVVAVQVAADVGNVACYHSNRPLSHPCLFFLNRNFLPAYSQQQIVEL